VVDITYVGKSDGDYFDLFHVIVDGRPVMEILVCPENTVWVAGVSGFGVAVPQQTAGVVHRHRDEWFEQNGIDSEHVCLGSIRAFVVPRIASLMARVYCPTTQDVK
jgi:hypothetical protein